MRMSGRELLFWHARAEWVIAEEKKASKANG